MFNLLESSLKLIFRTSILDFEFFCFVLEIFFSSDCLRENSKIMLLGFVACGQPVLRGEGSTGSGAVPEDHIQVLQHLCSEL